MDQTTSWRLSDLGLPTTESKLMQLKKPMYGLCDAPRAWYMEAVERILSLDNVYRHSLDACLFMVFDPNKKSQLSQSDEQPNGSPGLLVAAFGIHVDDLLGCGDINNDIYQKVKKQLHELFSFRMWEESGTLQYCGCDIISNDGGVLLKQADYINKQKPITLPTSRKSDPTRHWPKRRLHNSEHWLELCSGLAPNPHLTFSAQFPNWLERCPKQLSALLTMATKFFEWLRLTVMWPCNTPTWVISMTSHLLPMLTLPMPTEMTWPHREDTFCAWSTNQWHLGTRASTTWLTGEAGSWLGLPAPLFQLNLKQQRKQRMPCSSLACFGGWSSTLDFPLTMMLQLSTSTSTSTRGGCQGPLWLADQGWDSSSSWKW